ncbi:hypothetical protein QUF49_03005 [Fictibacillus sp. b24]|uniref:hypothetical protein n=1 Tax=Fictibacillus sp. b24 TaxID=3055863 RepID=UPI00259FF413|nr:hypothetical protein [Fictibacillus sp. b24]MDM5314946.1 hypothetical protein [Fictibacillus sp. b24]
MEDKLRDLKEKMNSTLLKDLDFNERRQRHVLREIKGEEPPLLKINLSRTWRFTLSTVLMTSLLFGLSMFVSDQLDYSDNSDTRSAENIDKKENTNKVNDIHENKRKEWRDLSSVGNLEKPDFATNVKEWVPQTLEKLEQPVPDKYPGAGVDEGYDIYLKSEMLRNMLGKYIRVEGEDLEKDFQNLGTLTALIGHDQFVRTAHLDSNGNAKEKTEYMNEWKPANEETLKAFEYMKQLLHDIDVAINKDGKGETYGVSHQLDGQNVNELEALYRH